MKKKLFLELLGITGITLLIMLVLYWILWNNRGGNRVPWLIHIIFGTDLDTAVQNYRVLVYNNRGRLWIVTMAFVSFMLLNKLVNRFTAYFDITIRGIESVLSDDTEIRFPTEMVAVERRLNALKQTLKQRTWEAQLAEQRKNDLVMYLAHDIRTPLTSIIGYLNLMEEASDMPSEQREHYIHIVLDKSYRLENMVNEFFEITRYNLQQITLMKKNIDLYYMLVQLTDEMSPILADHQNTAVILSDENSTIYGDPDKLARAFINILKNAASYSYAGTEITISVKEVNEQILIEFQNKGDTIPEEKLSSIFEKFTRLDEGRTSNTGGTGLGLSIAQEIINLHGGSIATRSENQLTTFSITLPGILKQEIQGITT